MLKMNFYLQLNDASCCRLLNHRSCRAVLICRNHKRICQDLLLRLILDTIWSSQNVILWDTERHYRMHEMWALLSRKKMWNVVDIYSHMVINKNRCVRLLKGNQRPSCSVGILGLFPKVVHQNFMSIRSSSCS